ncbi:MAG: helix-hairpin-helix domain-containing protein [Caldilineaceae bacterium]|nr:helix-hairpin-helix domain-containing protein [Caldilineaceae bacterium]
MNFKVAPDAYQKLSLLDNALDFEPAGNEPHHAALTPTPVERVRERTPKALPCISEVSTPTGPKPLLKAMMTTACERNCFYCPFRAGRNKTQRVTFSPDEMAQSFHTLQRAQVVDGLFLSSGIIKGSTTTQDKIIDTAEILRKRYQYQGYLHLKIMPGAEYDQIRRAMQLANRVSVNLEGATEARLQQLAPKKDYWQELFQRLQWISQLRKQESLRASVVTQFVVGAVGDTDVELLDVSEKLYHQLGLQRTYYVAFHPVSQTPFETVAPSSKQREHRLYQASFLLRDYGWSMEELAFEPTGNLGLAVDPKEAWAAAHLHQAPIEINRASRAELLHIPGIGPKSADAILANRRQQKFTELAHLRAVGVHDPARATPYILLNGRRPMQQLSLFSQ